MTTSIYTPPAGSFLAMCMNAHPNDDVRINHHVARAGSVARDVRHMLDEIERLTTENQSLTRIVTTLTDGIETLHDTAYAEGYRDANHERNEAE